MMKMAAQNFIDKVKQLLRVFENIYDAFESHFVPFPVGFHTTFVQLGFHSLPRR